MAGLTRLLIVLSAVAGAWLAVAEPLQSTCAAEAINREYVIKAAYLLNFLRYIEWPEVGTSSEKPFVIGILRPEPVSAYLRQAVESEELGKSVSVVIIDPDESIPPCHILYFPRSVAPEVQQRILKQVGNRSVVLVGETEGFLQWGGTINFVIVENKVRLEINVSRAEARGLKISSKLLQVARIVH